MTPTNKNLESYLEELVEEKKITGYVIQYAPHRIKLQIGKKTQTVNGGNDDVCISRIEELKL